MMGITLVVTAIVVQLFAVGKSMAFAKKDKDTDLLIATICTIAAPTLAYIAGRLKW